MNKIHCIFTESIPSLNMHFFQPKKLLLHVIIKYLKTAYIVKFVELLFTDFHRFIGKIPRTIYWKA